MSTFAAIMRCHLAVNDPSYVLYRGACYHFSVVALPWHTGKGACQGLEGDLMSIDAEEEMSLIRGTCATYSNGNVLNEFAFARRLIRWNKYSCWYIKYS